MTYAGLGSILFRFVGVMLICAMLVMLIPAVVLEGAASVRSQIFLSSGLVLLPAAVLIVVSKPLGRILAAGLE